MLRAKSTSFFAVRAGCGTEKKTEQEKPEPCVGFNTGESLFCFLFSDSIIVDRRPFIMLSDSDLLTFIFRSENNMGLLIQTDFAKSDGIKSDLRIRWPKSSDFGRKSDDSTHRIIKSKNGFVL